MSAFLRKFICDESGASAIEYGLLAALIAVIVITSMKKMGTKLSGTFEKVAGSIGS